MYQVICPGPHRGEPKPPENKQPAPATTSAAAAETPTAEVITSMLTAVIGMVAGRMPGGRIAVKAIGGKMSKRAAEKRAWKAQLKAGRQGAPGLKGASYQLGKSDGGPGKWAQTHTPPSGSAYQQQVTGALHHVEYTVPAKTASGRIKFDGYDSQRKVLIGAKDLE